MKEKTTKRSGLIPSRVYSVVILWMMMAISIFFGSCEKEQLARTNTGDLDTIVVIRNQYQNSERTLSVSAVSNDTLAKSIVVFKQTATMIYYDEEQTPAKQVLNLEPTLYCNITLRYPRLEQTKGTTTTTALKRSYIQSQTPYKNGYTYGMDIIKVFEFLNGQVATINYGWRYLSIVSNTDTLALPHAEITDLSFVKETTIQQGTITNTEEPYRATLVFNASVTTKGVSGRQTTNTVKAQPFYNKVLTSTATIVEKVTYSGKYLGCPYETYELKETVKTNKNEFTNTYKVGISTVLNAPDTREQPSTDSLFNNRATGKLNEKVFAENTNADGFTMRTMTGSYVSSNKGKENGSNVESTVNFTYQFPVKFTSQYGSYTIPPIALNFTEQGFSITKISETDEAKLFRTTNLLSPKLGDCTMDALVETVNLRVLKAQPANVVPVDSTYTLSGTNDDYIVDKEVIYSNGSKSQTHYAYQGRHNASAQDFGEVYTSSLNWNAGSLTRSSQSTSTDEKKFSNTTKFTATYTTSTYVVNATNGTESGKFTFVEEYPSSVVFKDGNTTKTFNVRKYVLTAQGASRANTPSTVIRNAITYQSYAYTYKVSAAFNGGSAQELVSNGSLLIAADVTGEPQYSYNQTWNGNTTTVTVTKTTPHTQTQNEVQNYSQNFTINMTELSNGRVTAENTNFTTTSTHIENPNSVKTGPWQITSYRTPYVYTVSNGTVSRQIENEITDAIITFNDGSYSHEFNIRLNVSKSETFGSKTTEGDYDITPHKLTITATTSGKTLTTTGTTNIYVKRQPSEPPTPNYGKPLDFKVTATYDPSASVTRRAFVFRWERGVTYAVCVYETSLPKSSDFKHKSDTYTGYNSVGYDATVSDHWQPARGTDSADAIRWYRSTGGLMSGIDKALTCKIIGWKNIVNGQYALEIPGYSYTINGYYITVTAPNGEKVTFDSHYE